MRLLPLMLMLVSFASVAQINVHLTSGKIISTKYAYLGGLFFYTVVNRDPFAEVFGNYMNWCFIKMKFSFKAKIYKVGINPCVKVPLRITKTMTAKRGYIPVTGTIEGYAFRQTLCPVKDLHFPVQFMCYQLWPSIMNLAVELSTYCSRSNKHVVDNAIVGDCNSQCVRRWNCLQ